MDDENKENKEDSRVLQPMIEEDRATRITNQVVKRYKPRTRLLPNNQSMKNCPLLQLFLQFYYIIYNRNI